MMPPRDERRHDRQIRLPQVGEAGQRAIAGASAMVVGVGALGSHAAEALARAGIGRLALVDRDVVEWTNLHRQALYAEPDAAAGRPKADAAAERLAAIASGVEVVPLAEDLRPASASRVLDAAGPIDLILDGTDNFATRYLLNDLAVSRGIPLVYGGAVGTAGTTAAIVPGATPCLRCLAPEPPPPGSTPTCDTAGVLPMAPAVIAHLQAAAALRLIVEGPRAPAGRLLSIDVWTGGATSTDLAGARDPRCPCCGLRRFEFLEGRDDAAAATLCGRDAVQILPPPAGAAIDLDALADRLASLGPVTRHALAIRATLTDEPGQAQRPIELTVFPDGRAIVHHTARPERARSLYARYVGA
jgi:molybdopterin/thiamine biosynthesis adenylyltransferase